MIVCIFLLADDTINIINVPFAIFRCVFVFSMTDEVLDSASSRGSQEGVYTDSKRHVRIADDVM